MHCYCSNKRTSFPEFVWAEIIMCCMVIDFTHGFMSMWLCVCAKVWIGFIFNQLIFSTVVVVVVVTTEFRPWNFKPCVILYDFLLSFHESYFIISFDDISAVIVG